jgi:anaerobic ribonucleoside-triphosphate reductase activating protein
MRVHAKIERSTVNGPGVRAVVFLQGCSLACPGCQNPETHHPDRGEFMTSVGLADWILGRPGITGVTFSGGEPLEQLEDGLDLTIGLVRDRRPDFSIGIFTGYTRQELGAGNFRRAAADHSRAPKYRKGESWAWLTTKIDWAVMGRYNQSQPCADPMRSSRNQELVHFSDRDAGETFPPQVLELTISPDGKLAQITGFPQGQVREITALGVRSNVCR